MRCVAAFGLAAILLAPATVQAKVPIEISVCGASGCAATADLGVGHDPFGGADVESVRPAVPGAYYRVELDLGGGVTRSLFYVPGAGALAGRGESGWTSWQTIGGKAGPVVRRLARRVRPFAAPTLTRAFVRASPLPGAPTAYLALLRARRFALPGDGTPVPVELVSRRPSPWTNTKYRYWPEDDVLQRAPGDFVRLPAPLAARLDRAARSLHGAS